MRVSPRGRGTFLCAAKEKYPKEIRPGRCAAHTTRGSLFAPGVRQPRAHPLSGTGRETNSPAAIQQQPPLGLDTVSRKLPVSLAVLGLLYGGFYLSNRYCNYNSSYEPLGFARLVGCAAHGSSGHGCLGYLPFSSFFTSA